jgi:GntR family transcriptional regulator
LPVTETAYTAIDFRSFEPYYLQLKRILMKEMVDNSAEGNLLPSEAELCSRYSVSRTVVRQALAELENDGLVLKVKGKGTFVTGRKLDTRFIQDNLGFYESMTRAGHLVQSRVLKLAAEPATVDVARRLEIGIGEEIVRFDRVRSVDSRPVQVVRAFMPARLLPGFVDLDMTDRSLYQVLRDSYGLRPASGHRAIEAVPLSREDAGHLKVPKGAPGLRVDSITRSSEGTVFEHFIAHYRGNSFRFELEVRSAPAETSPRPAGARKATGPALQPGAARPRPR